MVQQSNSDRKPVLKLWPYKKADWVGNPCNWNTWGSCRDGRQQLGGVKGNKQASSSLHRWTFGNPKPWFLLQWRVFPTPKTEAYSYWLVHLLNLTIPSGTQGLDYCLTFQMVLCSSSRFFLYHSDSSSSCHWVCFLNTSLANSIVSHFKHSSQMFAYVICVFPPY